MFDVGFSEVLLLGIIALLVLGPERLPKAARIFGGFVRKARRSFEGVKQEIEREIDADELKRTMASMPTVASIEAQIRAPFQEVSSAIENERQSMMQGFDDLRPDITQLDPAKLGNDTSKPSNSQVTPAALELTPERALEPGKPAAT